MLEGALEEVKALKMRIAQRAPARSVAGECARCAEREATHQWQEAKSRSRYNAARRDLTACMQASTDRVKEHAAELAAAATERDKVLSRMQAKMDKQAYALHRQLDSLKEEKRVLHQELSQARLSVKDFNRELNSERAAAAKLTKEAEELETVIDELRTENDDLKKTLKEVDEECQLPESEESSDGETVEANDRDDSSDDNDGGEAPPKVSALHTRA